MMQRSQGVLRIVTLRSRSNFTNSIMWHVYLRCNFKFGTYCKPFVLLTNPKLMENAIQYTLLKFLFAKGQTNSKWFFKPTFLPKNERTNSILLLVDLFSFVFWKKVKTPKRHFEINWPLVTNSCSNFNLKGHVTCLIPCKDSSSIELLLKQQ